MPEVSERDEALPRALRVDGVPAVSMGELLASCAAASVVSTPPLPPAEDEELRHPEAA